MNLQIIPEKDIPNRISFYLTASLLDGENKEVQGRLMLTEHREETVLEAETIDQIDLTIQLMTEIMDTEFVWMCQGLQKI